MPLVARKVWTNGRKWLGNLLPAIFFLPLAGWGIYWMLENDTILGKGLWLFVLGTLLGWVGLNLFGLVGNSFLKRELKRELTSRNVDFSDPHIFVGFSSPKFVSILDAHEDIGFLFLRSEVLEFVGENNDLKIPRSEIQGIYFRPNVHTWVGLGRWLCVEGTRKGKRYRMNVEPREKNFLLLNFIDSVNVRNKLANWRTQK